VPLRDVLQRMLRDETYMIGVRTGSGSENGATGVEVSWVHVTGSKSGTTPAGVMPTRVAAPTVKVPESMAGFGVSPKLITQALGSQNAGERREAARQLAEHLETNPGELDAFLTRDLGTTADELAIFQFANETLHTLSTRQKNAVAKAKLNAIVKMVDLRRANATKQQNVVEMMQEGMPH